MIFRFFWKALLNSIVAIPLLMWFGGASFTNALLASLLLSVTAYVIGDQMILRLTNNAVATAADVLLAFAFLWMAADFMDWPLTFTEIGIISLGLGVVELFLHRYFQQGRATVSRY